jgi:hypothetical protein
MYPVKIWLSLLHFGFEIGIIEFRSTLPSCLKLLHWSLAPDFFICRESNIPWGNWEQNVRQTCNEFLSSDASSGYVLSHRRFLNGTALVILATKAIYFRT